MRKLAIHGGQPVRREKIDSAALRKLRFDSAEKEALLRVVDSGVLCRAFGSEANTFEEEFSRYFGSGFAVASSSGTAAIHTALAAVGVGWQDEVITSPITDMGSIIGIVSQGARPVFADVDPLSYNMTPAAVEKAITEWTRAVLVVHLAGLSCDMGPILEAAARRGVAVVEDCAQSWLASYRGKRVGTFGRVGCFSLNGYKHIETGDGGLCVTGEAELARRMRLFVDKAYDRAGGGRNPEFFAMNYRLTELQAAVGRVQLKKLASIIDRREKIAFKLLRDLEGVPGLVLPAVTEGSRHAWWYFVIRADREKVKIPAAELSQALEAEGVPAWTGYCGGRPVYLYDCFTDSAKSFYRMPPLSARPGARLADLYPEGLCPVAEEMLKEMIIIAMSEFYSAEDTEVIAEGIRKVFGYYAR